jgi:hypothetical protein
MDWTALFGLGLGEDWHWKLWEKQTDWTVAFCPGQCVDWHRQLDWSSPSWPGLGLDLDNRQGDQQLGWPTGS